MPKIVISQKKKRPAPNHEYPLWKIARGYESICKMQWPAPPKEFRRKAVSNG